ncbi:hypothetical protein B296_00001624 [Ensete ventricosum]|uniref:Uncharacterized protein n=1 Tax=Ensete ventricosum TaxID=4639 RepID=A0A426YZN1_ENSVE|nr:hypothetical protein B296_00001624 [Ensete ventricosum]
MEGLNFLAVLGHRSEVIIKEVFKHHGPIFGKVMEISNHGIEAQDPNNDAPILVKSRGHHELLGDGLSYSYASSRCVPRVGLIRAARELDCFSAHLRLREPAKSKDKAEGRTSVESSIPCSHGGRALVVKGAEEVENAKANSKYQDRVEGQRPRNIIRPTSMGFSSR